MSTIDGLILGIVQGITEFLPISSSAHLVIVPAILKMSYPSIFFDILVHCGTLSAIFIFWRKRIKEIFFGTIKEVLRFKFRMPDEENARFGYLIIIGTIPTGIMGLLFKDFFERLFAEPIFVAILLMITGALLFLTRFSKEKKALLQMGVFDALVIGVFQALAIAPGISRSGACISSGLFLGLKRELAFDFAFLLSIPAILGAFILKFKDAKDGFFLIPYIVGFIFSFMVGLASLYILGKIVKRGKIHYFSYYCWIFGLFMILIYSFFPTK